MRPPVTLSADHETVSRTLDLLVEPGSVVELRCFHERGTYGGTFDNMEALVREAVRASNGGCAAVYFLPNPLVLPATNRLKKFGRGEGATNDDVTRRIILIIDLDPERPKEILPNGDEVRANATDAEKAPALERAHSIAAFLTERGLPEPILADSGNGFHLLYLIDLSPESSLVRDVIYLLAERFSDDAVRIDKAVHNAGRIWKLYGTAVRKGPHSNERPHRLSQIIFVPEGGPERLSEERILALLGIVNVEAESAGAFNAAEEEVRCVLGFINGRPPYDDWLKICWGVVDKVGDVDTAIRLLKEWRPEEVQGEYEKKLKHNTRLERITFGTVVYYAKQGGYVPPRKPRSSSEQGSEEDTPSFDLLMQAAAPCQFFQGHDGDGYARFPCRGGYRTVAIRSRLFEEWLRNAYYELALDLARRKKKKSLAPSSEAMKSALNTLLARAKYDPSIPGKQRVFLRTAGTYDEAGRLVCIYVDLANEAGEVIEIMPGSYRVITDPPVQLVRTSSQHPLPRPDPDGSLADLLPFLRTERADEATFVLAWLVFALHPDGPYQLLVLHGPAGSGKSVLTKYLRSLVDPVQTLVQRPPKTSQDLFVAAKSNAVVALENISKITPQLSDDLCSIATGAGVGSRELYTNADEFSYTVKRPILINGIDEFVERNDLASRTMKVHIRPLKPKERQTEWGLKQQMREARPRILGGICKALAAGLKHLDDKAEQLPRMADFADFIDGGQAAFPPELPRLIDALRQLHDEMARERAEASAIVTAFQGALAASDGRMEGDMTTWWKELRAYAGSGGAWPDNVWAFRSDLRREHPVMQHMGIEVRPLSRKDPKTRRELYEAVLIRDEEGDPSHPSDPSPGSRSALQSPENVDFAAKDDRRMPEGSKDAAKDSAGDPSDEKGRNAPGNAVCEGSKDAKDPLTYAGDGAHEDGVRAVATAEMSSLIDFDDDEEPS